MNRNASVYAAANAPVRALGLRVLVCPTQSSRLTYPLSGAGSGSGGPSIGVTSYAACHHDVEAPIASNNNGVFFHNSHITFKDVRDGLSQTIFLGEKLVEMGGRTDLGWMSGTRATLRNMGNALAAGGGTARIGLLAPPDDPPNFVGGFASWHPVVVLFAFGDGRVTALRTSTNAAILSQLGHRADGQLLSDADY